MTLRLSIAAVCLLMTPLLACSESREAASEAPVAEAPATQEIAWESLLPNPRQPMEGVLSGGQPTAEQLSLAAEAGFKTVINLRMPGERGGDDEAAQVESLGMTYVHLPIDGAADMTEEKARALDIALAEAERPVMLHCGSGNRVGGLLALRTHYVDGLGVEEAMSYGLDSGLTRLEGAVRASLEGAGD